MDHQEPLLSSRKANFYVHDDWKSVTSGSTEQSLTTDMGIGTSRVNNRIADFSWSFPSLTMDEVLNLKKTYETLAMLSPRDNLISKATFMHYFKLGKVIGSRFFALLDKDGDGKINLTEFLEGLSICLHGTFEEKSRLLFKMFDVNVEEKPTENPFAACKTSDYKRKALTYEGDDFICEEDLSALLPFVIRACKRGTYFSGNVVSSQVNKGVTMDFDDEPGSIITNLFTHYDTSQTGKLSLDNFCDWIHRYPSFVDAVFQCDFFINFMTPRYSSESHPDMKDSSSHPSLQSQTWMEEEIEVEKIMEVSQMIHLSNARFLWKPVFPTSASAKVPGTRFKHTTVFYKGCVYLLSGRGKQNTFKDIWRYFVDDNFWEKLQAEGPGPPALQEHSAVLYGNLMYVFGGAVSSDAGIPLWCLDLDCLRWLDIPKCRSGPSNRRGHSAVVHFNSMFVFGGFSDMKGSTNEFWNYCFETNVWALIRPQHSRSEMVPARYSHSATVYNNAMWIFGGFETLDRKSDLWRWDFDLSLWSKTKFRQGPPPLSGHSMAKVGGNIIIFGGESNSGLSNELWRYSFESYKWSKVSPYGGISPPVRSFQSIIVLSPFVAYEKASFKMDNDSKQVSDDYFVRNTSGSKRSFGSKSNSANDILNVDKDSQLTSSSNDITGQRPLNRPHSVIEQMCNNFQELEAFTPVEVTESGYSKHYPTQETTLRSINVGNESSDRRANFQIEDYDKDICLDASKRYTRRSCWSLVLIGGRGKHSVDMHKTSLDVWQCDIGQGPDIPPVNRPDESVRQRKKDLFLKHQDNVPYDRFDTPPSPTKSSKRKFQSYDLLEVTDISDEVCFESSPEQKPKLQENRRLLSYK